MRPRQIDITKPLPVVWLKTDEVSHQAQAFEGVCKSLTVSKRSTEQVKQKNAELVQSQTRVPVKASIGEVPIPDCRIVDQGQEPDPPFERGQSYIHYLQKPYDFEVVEYELDDDDLDFVDEWNEECERRRDGNSRLTEEGLEVMLNVFENQAYLLRNSKDASEAASKVDADSIPGAEASEERGGLVVQTEEALEKLREFAREEGVDEDIIEFLQLPTEDEPTCAVCRQTQRTSDQRERSLAAEITGASTSLCVNDQPVSTTPARTRQQPGRTYVLGNSDDFDPTRPLPYKNPERLLCCSQCHKYVHIRCYLPAWLPAAEDGPWLCDYCDDITSDLSASKSTKCELCPIEDGLLKRVRGSSHKRAHITCALFIPETYLMPVGVAGIEDVHPGRWSTTCKLCQEQGACIQCKARYCRSAFHPMCAHEEMLHMDTRTSTAFCQKHTAEKREEEDAGEPHTGARARTVDIQLLVNTPAVKERSFRKLSCFSETVLKAGFVYWFRKRYRKGCAIVPRLALMQKEEKERDASKRRRGKKVRLEDQEWVDRFLLLRQDLERARILLDMVRRRETLKREWTAHSKDIFELYIEREEQRALNGKFMISQAEMADIQPESTTVVDSPHLWEYEPEQLPEEEVELLFPDGKRPRRTTTTTIVGNGKVRVLERDPDGRFRGSGKKKSNKKKDAIKRVSTGRPVGRPRKYPLPEPPMSAVQYDALVHPQDHLVELVTDDRVLSARPIDVMRLESDSENSEVDIDGGLEDFNMAVHVPVDLFDNEQHMDDAIDVCLGKRKSARLSEVPLPSVKKRR